MARVPIEETPPMVPEGEAVKCHALQGGYAVPGQFKIGRNERGFKMKQKEHAALIFQDDPDALLLTPVAAEFLGISPRGREFESLRTRQ